LVEAALGGPVGGAPLVANARQKAALLRAERALCSALEADERGLPPEIVAVGLAEATRALGEITGEDATEDLLDAIFARFCIGK
jgi:tRNA modification GTPase